MAAWVGKVAAWVGEVVEQDYERVFAQEEIASGTFSVMVADQSLDGVHQNALDGGRDE